MSKKNPTKDQRAVLDICKEFVKDKRVKGNDRRHALHDLMVALGMVSGQEDGKVGRPAGIQGTTPGPGRPPKEVSEETEANSALERLRRQNEEES